MSDLVPVRQAEGLRSPGNSRQRMHQGGTTMKPFCLEGKCQKCGGEAIGVRYCTGSEWYRCCSLNLSTEHLHRSCSRCHYEWAERCQEAKPTPEQPRENELPARWLEARTRIAELEAEVVALRGLLLNAETKAAIENLQNVAPRM